jgi:hypothetical protein
VYRDIKLSNILCPATDDEGHHRSYSDDFSTAAYHNSSSSMAAEPAVVVKLADFGMAGKAGSDGCLRGRCGTPGYVRASFQLYHYRSIHNALKYTGHDQSCCNDSILLIL